MSTTLTLDAVDVTFGARTLVTDLTLTLADGDVTALVGPNGSGKSSVMRTIAGELPLEAGTIRLGPRTATVAHLPQVPPDPAETLHAYARRRTGVTAADRELQRASTALADDEPGAQDRYADALERWLSLGGADLDDRLPEVAASVGLDVDPHRPLGSLSGGQAARACLVAVLLSRYDVLLLDEPTNDLDAHGLALVADFVRSHRGPVLVASHDRAFLDDVATGVVELDLHQQRVNHYTGGWTAYVDQRDLARHRAREAYEAYAGSRDALEERALQRRAWAAKGHRAVRRGDEPDKHLRTRFRARADRQLAKSAQLRRAADRLDVVAEPRKEWRLRYRITEGPASADVVTTLVDAVVERDGFRLGPVTLTLARGDRVAVSGDNGSGKSTLLRALLGEAPLASGRAGLGARVRLGVLDQQRSDLDTDVPLLEVVTRLLEAPGGRRWEAGEARTLLAKFGLGAEHVHRPARTLSMGERTRALMAVFQGREVNVLVLDEPTNHLDVPAVEQLEEAVAAFGGTVVVVSHDARLVDAIAPTHVWHVEDGGVDVEVVSPGWGHSPG